VTSAEVTISIPAAAAMRASSSANGWRSPISPSCTMRTRPMSSFITGASGANGIPCAS
jgi:hypothetical protein